MLTELRVRDFVIIDSLELEFHPGFNVITGETGAGKSILIDSIALLLGDRAEAGMVRAGCERAIVEGAFRLDAPQQQRLKPRLDAHAIELERGELTLAREVRGNGRTVCRVNGNAVSQAILREVGEWLVDVHGQGEHLSLLRVKEHVNLLDDFAGTWELRRQVAARVAELRGAERQLADIERNAREHARRADMLKFQVEEILAGRLKPGEEAVLSEEHTRLANAETISELAAEAYASLYESGSRDQLAALDQIAHAGKALAALARYDKQFHDLHKSLEEAAAILGEVARSTGDYRGEIEFNPKRLQQVESRLELLKKLKRKYGETVEAVIAYGEQAAREMESIGNADERMAGLKARIDALRKDVDGLAAKLSTLRRAACERLAKRVERELDELKMAGARFEVGMLAQPPDASGADAVEFMIAPNPGEGLKPLARVASGGETARLMLALKAVLATSTGDAVPTLVFDEVDQGIGGRVGTVVGHKLWALTGAHQVLCITHLPQLASFADAHFKVEKAQLDGPDGPRTRAQAVLLGKRARLDELAQMLGTTGKTGQHGAEQLLAEAAGVKEAAGRQHASNTQPQAPNSRPPVGPNNG